MTYLNGKDSREDGTCDANCLAVIQKLEECVRPEEQLGDDKICSRIHLIFKVPQILLIALCLRVTCGVTWIQQHISIIIKQHNWSFTLTVYQWCGSWTHTSYAYVKIVIKLRSDVFNKVNSIVEASLFLLPVHPHWICGDITKPHLSWQTDVRRTYTTTKIQSDVG